jgi:hypothetical protein
MRNIHLGLFGAVGSVVVRPDLCADSSYAEFVFENWLVAERFLVLAKLHGKLSNN